MASLVAFEIYAKKKIWMMRLGDYVLIKHATGFWGISLVNDLTALTARQVLTFFRQNPLTTHQTCWFMPEDRCVQAWRQGICSIYIADGITPMLLAIDPRADGLLTIICPSSLDGTDRILNAQIV